MSFQTPWAVLPLFGLAYLQQYIQKLWQDTILSKFLAANFKLGYLSIASYVFYGFKFSEIILLDFWGAQESSFLSKVSLNSYSIVSSFSIVVLKTKYTIQYRWS